MGSLEQERTEPYSFRNLGLWQKSEALAVAIIRLVDRLPRGRSTDIIANQFVRAATSIGANIAEGHGRYTLAAYRNHLSIARGSAAEAQSWLSLIRSLEYIDAEQAEQIDRQFREMMPGLTSRMRALESQIRQQEHRIRESGLTYSTDDGALDTLIQ